MPQTRSFNNLLFKEAAEKCTFYGVQFSEDEFMVNPDKYCVYIDRYNEELKQFIEKNTQKLIELQKSFIVNNTVPKHIAFGQARLNIEKEFQEALLDKLASSCEEIDKDSELSREEKEKIIKNIKANIANYRQKKSEERNGVAKGKKNQHSRARKSTWNKIKERFAKTIKVLAVSAPIFTFGYMTYFGIKNPGQINKDSRPKQNKEVLATPKKTTNNGKNLNFETVTKISSRIAVKPRIKVNGAENVLGATLPSHNYKDINSSIPVLANDPLLQLPNIDLFNYCFNMSNDYLGKYTKYGVSRDMYNQFMSSNASTARMNKIPSYDNLSYTDLRVIAKTEIFDAYDIGFMQNRSIASYMYNILLKQTSDKNYVAAVAQGVKDFYSFENKEISHYQNLCLERLMSNNKIDISDWRQLIALINKTAINSESESKLFSFMKNRVENSGLAAAKLLNLDNQRFAYEPTLKEAKVLVGSNKTTFLPNINTQNYDKIDDLYARQKDRDIEVFFSIYEQCSHENYVNLKYGSNKRLSFNEANKALRDFDIYSTIHPSLYCAGMSMASFCQAAKIFKEENPDSYVNNAIDDFINSCQNIHSCITLKNDMNMISSSVHRSYNIESDVKKYMEKNNDAILFVWSPRGQNNYHHQTVFPAAKTNSNDTYTYCAFNNQHWGNENTFARHMRSRSQYGRGGYYADVKSTLNYLTERNIEKELNKVKLSLSEYPTAKFCYFDNSLS